MRGQTRRRLLRLIQKKTPWVRSLSFGMCAAVAQWSLYGGTLEESFDHTLLGTYFFLSPKSVGFPSEVAFVALDQESYRQEHLSLLKPWPWTTLATLVSRVAKNGAARILIDLPLGEINDRDHLRDVLSLVPTYFIADAPEETTSIADGALTENVISPSALAGLATIAPVISSKVLGDDGVVYRLYRGANGVPPLAAILDPEERRNGLPGMNDFIRYYGPPGSIRTVSAFRVMNEQEHSVNGSFRGKTVILGMNTGPVPGISGKEGFPTSITTAPMSGIEIHGTVVANLLRGDWIRRGPPNVERVCLSLTGFVIGMALSVVRPFYGLVLLIPLELGFFVAGFLALSQDQFLPGVLLIAVILPVAFVSHVALVTASVRRTYDRVENSFGIRLH